MRQPLRSHRFMLPLVLLALAFVMAPVARVAAHEEGNSVITLRAPLDAADCTATPPTITVLGLTIDVSTATFGAGHGDSGENDNNQGDDGDNGNNQDDGENDDDQGGGDTPPSCADLVVGQPVVITFASDAAPLIATSVTQSGDGDNGGDVEIKAPLQAVDSTLLTVTLLGLTIDASTATIEGNDGEGDQIPTDLTQAMPGEFADVLLDATKLPALVATHVEIRIDTVVVLQAPLDAADCAATPPTITVLGLTIDVSTASIHAGGDDDGEDGEGDDGDDEDGNGGGCAALVPGRLVRVVLASDVTPLVATQVKQIGEDDEGVEIRAPIQSADSSAMTVTLLGLVIDVSTAGLDGGAPPVDFTKVVVGQIAEAHLDATKLPALVATTLEVTDVGSDVDVEVDDPSGTEIDDPTDDVDVNVDIKKTVTVHNGAKRVKTTSIVHVHTTGHGSFHLSGLPAGAAKISVARVQAGVTMARSRGARLKVNKTQKLRLRLKPVHAH